MTTTITKRYRIHQIVSRILNLRIFSTKMNVVKYLNQQYIRINKQTQFLEKFVDSYLVIEKFVKQSDEFDKEEEIIATNGETFPWDDLRLPKFIHPVRYDIELTPNLTSLWVKGIYFCLIKWKQYSKIKWHFHELNVRKFSVSLYRTNIAGLIS